jgi:hypothetical protein
VSDICKASVSVHLVSGCRITQLQIVRKIVIERNWRKESYEFLTMLVLRGKRCCKRFR